MEIEHSMELISTLLFATAVFHTFNCSRLQHLSHRFEPGSVRRNLFHFLGEVEVVFGIWAAIFILIWGARYGIESAATYLRQINYTEALFVFVIMCMSATRPILYLARAFIGKLAGFLKLSQGISTYITTLVVGPLLGALITEPAAMTVTALLLKESFFSSKVSQRFKYATLGLLFVNVSIGGTLTHFAAPPVLMVARAWQWNTLFTLTTFGWRAALAILIGTLVTAFVFRREFVAQNPAALEKRALSSRPTPPWLVMAHLVFIALTIAFSHYIVFFVPIFLFFLGFWTVTAQYQDELKIRESLLVAYFLAGLVTLGNLQGWWLRPLIAELGDTVLFWSATALTAVTDNAALTYLGTLVPDLSTTARYAIVAGAVTGGGLTVIANAPNPAGYTILSPSFGNEGIAPLSLFLGALPYTLLAALMFLL